jgi:hypothetical protein
VTPPDPANQDRHRASRIEYPPNPRLQRMRALSRLLDNSILLPGGYRIGLDPIIGLLPGAGDFIAAALSIWIIYDAARLGVRKRVLGRMIGNVILESVVGSVPVLGDLFDAAWKANARNLKLVEVNFSPATQPRSFREIFGILAATLLMILMALAASLYACFKLLQALFESLGFSSAFGTA